MAAYKGKPENKIVSGTQNQIKGHAGENIVTNKLVNILPDDTTVVSLPQIGKYEPDLLVISPHYGIRIIEVKNWSLGAITNAHVNGLIEFRNKAAHNPMQQAKLQTDGILHLLEKEFPQHFKGRSPVGYIVIHNGFTREEFERRFPKFIDSLEYWKHHMTTDEMESGLDERLRKAAKFPGPISCKVMEDILNVVQYREQLASEISILRSELELKFEALGKKLEEINEISSEKMHQSSSNQSVTVGKVARTRNKPLIIAVVFTVLLIMLAVLLISNNPLNPGIKAVKIGKANLYEGQTVTLSGTSQEFYFDQTNSTKFFTLADNTGKIRVVIFKDTKIPFIGDGKQVEVIGKVQKYKGEFQIVVDSVKSE